MRLNHFLGRWRMRKIRFWMMIMLRTLHLCLNRFMRNYLQLIAHHRAQNGIRRFVGNLCPSYTNILSPGLWFEKFRLITTWLRTGFWFAIWYNGYICTGWYCSCMGHERRAMHRPSGRPHCFRKDTPGRRQYCGYRIDGRDHQVMGPEQSSLRTSR